MSKAVPFDTLAYAKKLEAHGVANQQAEAHAEVLAEVLETNFLTKKDSDIAIKNLAHEISSLRGEVLLEFANIKSEISIAKVDVIRWVVGTGIAAAGLVVGLLLKFIH